ncbi:Malate dehydrogenase, cytoplasmic [Neolecta irregularis DAH-3]|uniref:malate dehydrogenase n=1 Tax=Neolecta irregularis (strain DAH-3) TaxID=1198029 RepID=A0A1U7LWX3_NEOID|nr:Malate dehydrogenase, cytoplasmic [Neolecta irregularis DAH-3]|eukprot:OLL27011.1 Malate dehydrogenase, cytoplasmic [Neolecta irregularis DAH-3]
MVKVAVLGAAGGIGQPLSLLCKMSPLIDELALYDVVPALTGVAVDLSHIATKAQLNSHLPTDDGLKKALTGSDFVIIPAGVPRKPGMTRDDLFKINAGIVETLATGIAQFCPKAFILVISNPVNSTVPIVAEIMKKHGVFDPRRLFGVTTLDVIRASTFTSQLHECTNPTQYTVPVVGGHSGLTIIPLFSQAEPAVKLSHEAIKKLTIRIQFGGDEVVEAKGGSGSATLSMAYAGFKYVYSGSFLRQANLLHAVHGEKGIIESSYVHLSGIPGGENVSKLVGIDYFSVPIELGPDGAHKAHPLGELSDYELNLLEKARPELKGNVAKGVEFISQKSSKL